MAEWLVSVIIYTAAKEWNICYTRRGVQLPLILSLSFTFLPARKVHDTLWFSWNRTELAWNRTEKLLQAFWATVHNFFLPKKLLPILNLHSSQSGSSLVWECMFLRRLRLLSRKVCSIPSQTTDVAFTVVRTALKCSSVRLCARC